jgi:hypothetical protein
MQEGNMKFSAITLALAATAFGSVASSAQTTVIEQRPGVVVEERRAPPVVIEQRQTPVIVEQAPAQSTVTTQERGGFLGTETHTTTTTTGTGPNGDCATSTARHEDLLTSKTVTRTDCQ